MGTGSPWQRQGEEPGFYLVSVEPARAGMDKLPSASDPPGSGG